MSFVPMHRFLYCCMIISSTCLLLQSTIVTPDDSRSCYVRAPEVGTVEAETISEFSINVTWKFNHSQHEIFTDNLFDLVMVYRPCVQYGIPWPSLVRDPVTNIYLARYYIDESSFHSSKPLSWSRGEFQPMDYFEGDSNDSLPLASGMSVLVTGLPYPDWPYVFYLERIMNDLSHIPARVSSHTYSAPPKVCPGCFRTLWKRLSEQKREVRVYWPRKVNLRGHYLLYVYEMSNYHTAKLVHKLELYEEYGSVDVVIGLRSHIFLFIAKTGSLIESLRNSVLTVPDEQNVLEWVSAISTTANTTTGVRTLSWEKPITSEVIKYYTLVWYDKQKWRENQNHSPIMDWVYIRGNQTSIEFRMVDSEGDDDERVGWRLSVHTETWNSGIENFDDY